MSNFLISICIPTYNRVKALKNTLESIVKQKYFDDLIEVVISDNCSTDETSEIVMEFQEKYSNIFYYRNDNNVGAEKNVLKVLSLGKGQFLKLINDYTIFSTGSLKSLIDIVLSYQSTKAVIFFSNNNITTKLDITECQDIDQFFKKSSYWSTWVLCFGIWKIDFDFLIKGSFKEYNFPHLDLLLRNIKLGRKPVIFNKLLFTTQPLTEKGGYNLFEIFINNYLTLISQYVGEYQISKVTFMNEKRNLLHNFIYPWYCKVVIEKESGFNFESKRVNFYLLKYFSIHNILSFTYKVIKYKTARRLKSLCIMKFKKTIIKKVAKIFYTIIHSNSYLNIEKGFQYRNFKYFGVNSLLPSQILILNPQYISIGSNFCALQNLRIEAHDNYAGERFQPEIIIGDGVIMNTDIHIGCIDKVIIGNNVLLASRIYISDHSHGEITKEALILPPILRPLKSKGPVIIEDNVWIGEGVAILPGVTIGVNCIIGANSVVTKSIPPNCVVAGNPAKILKKLV